MIVLDTNVLSEALRPVPDPNVLAWLDGLPVGDVATTAITAAELLYGVTRLSSGRRKAELANAVHMVIDQDFRGRIEPFDSAAADQYAGVVTGRGRLGRPIGVADAQIASICRALDATLATRNIKDFEETGVELLDPWRTDG